MHTSLPDDPGMHGEATASLLGRRHVLIGGVLALAAGVAFARQPTAHNPVVLKSKFEEWIPETVGKWSKVAASGVVLPPPDLLSDRLYDNLVTGAYQAPDEPLVMFLMAYNNRQDGVLQVHRPEVCYPVGGYELSETRGIDLNAIGRSIPANIFTAVGPDRTEQVVYFTRLGHAFPRSWAEQRIAVARENLAGRVPDGIMMRVSILGADQQTAHKVLGLFTQDFIVAAPSPLKRLIFG